VHGLDDPIKKDSHLVVLYGNLAPEGAVAKITGKEGLRFTGTGARVRFRGASLQGILGGKVKKGDVVVIRYEGRRAARHARNAEPDRPSSSARAWAASVALITDGRFPAAATASWSATYRPRRRSAARSRW
jgi:dihydroxy-acid dehydratase